MTPHKLLHGIAIVLYGADWLPSLANTLRVSPKAARSWTNGQRKIPPGVWADLLALDDPRLARVRWRMERAAADSSAEQSGSSRRPEAAP